MNRVASGTDPGLVRTRNEDSALVGELVPGVWALVVCDGMGGHDAGDLASQAASQRIYQELNARRDAPDVPGALVDALHAAHDAVRELAAERGGSDMGTTAVIARLEADRLWFAWVGDSRLVVVRDGRVLTQTEDHTVVQRLIASGELHPDDAHDHPDLHVLSQCIGADPREIVPAVTDEPLTLEPGDRVMLCSDGLHDLVRVDELPHLLAGDPSDAVSRLIALAKERGGHDNITVVVAAHDGAAVAPGHRSPPPTRERPSGVRADRAPGEAASRRRGVPIALATIAVAFAFALGAAVGFAARSAL